VLFRWISEWLPLRQRRPGILVALLSRKPGRPFSALPKLDFFKEVAAKGNLDFGSDQGDLVGIDFTRPFLTPKQVAPAPGNRSRLAVDMEYFSRDPVSVEYPVDYN
jgi:hypothetical protein